MRGSLAFLRAAGPVAVQAADTAAGAAAGGAAIGAAFGPQGAAIGAGVGLGIYAIRRFIANRRARKGSK